MKNTSILILSFVLGAAIISGCESAPDAAAYKAPDIEAVQATVDRTQAQLQCSISSDRVDRCGFRYYLEGGATTEIECNVNKGTFTTTLTHLHYSSTYYYSAFIEAGGATLYSEIRSFQTEDLFSGDYSNIPANEFWYEATSPLGISEMAEELHFTITDNDFSDGHGVIRTKAPLVEIGEWAFAWQDNLYGVALPSSVKDIGYSSFRECPNPKWAYFSDGITVIGDSSFHNNQSLSDIRLPNTLVKIDKDAFSHAFSLEEIFLPDGLEVLAQSAFLNCTSLKQIDLPSSVKRLGYRAFDNDESLKYVIIRAITPPEGSELMFHNTAECPIYVPAQSVEAYKQAPHWRDYAHRIQAIPDSYNR